MRRSNFDLALIAWFGASLLFLVYGLAVPGCAPVQTPEGPILVAPQAQGERFAAEVHKLTGVHPGAFTLPHQCVPPIFLDGATAADPCAREHEAEHVVQRARERKRDITRNYGSELVRCWRAAHWAREAFDGCYRSVSYERAAYAREAECRARAGGSP